APFLELRVQVVDQPVAAALDDVAGQPLVEREGLGGGRRCPPLPEIGGEGGHRVVAPPVYEVLGQPPLLFRNGRIALQAFGVHDRVVEAPLGAVVGGR